MNSDVRIVHDNDGYPITLYKIVEVAKFRSMAEAARYVGVSKEGVRDAINKGIECNGYRFRFSDMPIDCQPFRPNRRRHRVPVIWEGKAYPSILAAAGKNRTLYKKIWDYSMRARNEL
jgi:hypothetical protein